VLPGPEGAPPQVDQKLLLCDENTPLTKIFKKSATFLLFLDINFEVKLLKNRTRKAKFSDDKLYQNFNHYILSLSLQRRAIMHSTQ
jgi:hypothetical protein